jgi:hypothetical protein
MSLAGLTTVIDNWVINQIGFGDCNEYHEISLGAKITGQECAKDCALEGYYMASWKR